MRQLSSDMLQALFAGETGEAVLGLVTIEEESLSEPLRFTSNGVSTFSADQESDTAEDKTSNGNDGTLVNGPTWTSDGPNDDVRGALSFDGVDDGIVVPDDASLDITDEITIEGWVYFDDVERDEYEQLITKSDNFGGAAYGIFRWRGGTERGVNARFNIGGAEVDVQMGEHAAEKEYIHVATTYDGSVVKLLIGGSEVDSESASGSIATTNDDLGIGSRANNQSAVLLGKMTDWRIWNYARTQKQIQDNMNKRLNGDEPGLVGYWPLNDTTKEFIPCPFRYSFPDQSDEGEVQAKLEIDNVDRRITKAVRNASGTPTVTTQLVLASTPDTIEAEFPDFELTNVGYDKLVVEGTLTVESMTSLPFPAHTFDPQKFPNLF